MNFTMYFVLVIKIVKITGFIWSGLLCVCLLVCLSPINLCTHLTLLPASYDTVTEDLFVLIE